MSRTVMMAKTAKGATKQAARTVRVPGFIVHTMLPGMRQDTVRENNADSSGH